MLQKLLIAIAQVKAGNASENLLNEICQITYSLYLLKEVAKKVHSGYKKIVKQNGSYKNNICWTL